MKKLFLISFLICIAFSGHAQTVGTTIKGTTVSTNSFIINTTQPGGKVFLITGYSATQQYIMGFSTNAVPPTGTRGIFSVPVLADNFFSIDYGYYGCDLDRLTICTSTTPYTYTPGASNATFQVILKR